MQLLARLPARARHAALDQHQRLRHRVREWQGHEQSHSRAAFPSGSARRNSSNTSAIAAARRSDAIAASAIAPPRRPMRPAAASCAPAQAPRPGGAAPPAGLAAARAGTSRRCASRPRAAPEPDQHADIDPGAERGAQRHARRRPRCRPQTSSKFQRDIDADRDARWRAPASRCRGAHKRSTARSAPAQGGQARRHRPPAPWPETSRPRTSKSAMREDAAHDGAGNQQKRGHEGQREQQASAAAAVLRGLRARSSPCASRADISGSSTVPSAMPSTPSGSWLMRSA